jgi:predicted metal-dependent peptidase
MTDTQLRIDQARWWSLTNQPFYGSLAMNLHDVITESVETVDTDGAVIAWNPSHVEKLTDEELRYVLLHQTLTCAHQHMWRLPDDKRGNEASDHEVNNTLTHVQGIKAPEGTLLDTTYDGKACEDIYRLLPDPEEGDGGGDGDGDGGDGDGGQSGGGGTGSDDGNGDGKGDGKGNGKGDSPTGTYSKPQSQGTPQQQAQQNQEMRNDWDQRVMQAAQAAQALGIGDVPADMQRMLEKLQHSEVDWRREMADFVKDAMSLRNDWSRAARRHAWQPVIYPRKHVDDVGTVLFARDTSGSINDKLCAEFTALIADAVSEMGCRGIVVDCDTMIQAEYEVNGWSEVPLTAKGGGGTKFQPVFDKADEMVAAGETVAGIVYLTDMMSFDLASLMSEIPTLWLATSDYNEGNEPFGRRVRIQMEQYS